MSDRGSLPEGAGTCPNSAAAVVDRGVETSTNLVHVRMRQRWYEHPPCAFGH
jgi:hypothetical protein